MVKEWMTDDENGILVCIRFPTVFSFYVFILFFIISACTLREKLWKTKENDDFFIAKIL